MKLKIVQPWYADGLSFTCTQCGNCCTGPPGYVEISDVELSRLAEFLKIPRVEVLERYCRPMGNKVSLKEKRGRGGWDCIFLEEREGKRICSIYPVRPLQCRTWPFWDGVLVSRRAWDEATKRCPGMNAPGRSFSREEIEKLRDATDWPEKPPTSAAGGV